MEMAYQLSKGVYNSRSVSPQWQAQTLLHSNSIGGTVRCGIEKVDRKLEAKEKKEF